jgi:uncharacterized C2H2 Zn-finger protein
VSLVYAYIDFARDLIPLPRVVLKDCKDQVDPEEPTVSKPVENVMSRCPLDLMEATLALPNNGQVEEVPSFSSSPPLEAALSNNEKEGPSASSPSSPLSETLFKLNCEYPNCSFVACCRLLASIPTKKRRIGLQRSDTLKSLSNHHLNKHAKVKLIDQDGQEYYECPTCAFVAVVSTTDENSNLSTTSVPLADMQRKLRYRAYQKLLRHYTHHLQPKMGGARTSLHPPFRRMLTRYMRKHLFGAKDNKVVVAKKGSQKAKKKPKRTDPEVNSQAPAKDCLDTTGTHYTSLLNREDVPVPVEVKEEVHFIIEDEDNGDQQETCPRESTAEVPPLPSFSSSPPSEVTLSNNEKEGPSATSSPSPLSETPLKLNCEYPNCSFVACCASIRTSNRRISRQRSNTLKSLSNHHLRIHSGVQLIEQDGQEYFKCPTCVFVAVVSTTEETSSLSSSAPLADIHKISRRRAYEKLMRHYTRHLEQNIAGAKTSLHPPVCYMLSQSQDNLKDNKVVVNKKGSLNPSESVGQDETDPQVNSQAPPSTEDFLDTTATHDTSLLKREDVPVPGVKEEVHFIIEDEDNNEEVQYWDSDAESDEEETCPLESAA